MRNKAYDVSSHVFSAVDRILPDANIWLYLYSSATVAYPSWLQRQIAPYYKAWKNLPVQGAKVFMDPLVFSEVINRLLDDEWLRIDPPDPRTRARTYAKRKDFRRSADYPAAARTVEALGRQIMSGAEALDHSFSCWNLDEMLTDFGSGWMDWNDQLIVETCRFHGLKLLTHDGDHVIGGLEVLTANAILLAACPI
jgi:predicted nucleic acid-binding protein